MNSTNSLQVPGIQENNSRFVDVRFAPDNGRHDDTIILCLCPWSRYEDWLGTVHVIFLPREHVSSTRVNLHQFASIVSINIAGDGIEISVFPAIDHVVVDGGCLTPMLTDDGWLDHHGVGVVINDVGTGGGVVKFHLVMVEWCGGVQWQHKSPGSA